MTPGSWPEPGGGRDATAHDEGRARGVPGSGARGDRERRRPRTRGRLSLPAALARRSRVASTAPAAPVRAPSGGRDLKYPHHDSEIVQSECATGDGPYVGTWMHNGMINLDGVKMSKSLGNLVKVSELLTQGHTPDAIRLMLLGTHYREDREFVGRPRSLGADRRPAARSLRGAPPPPPDQLRVQAYRNAFSNAMDDDLDTRLRSPCSRRSPTAWRRAASPPRRPPLPCSSWLTCSASASAARGRGGAGSGASPPPPPRRSAAARGP